MVNYLVLGLVVVIFALFAWLLTKMLFPKEQETKPESLDDIEIPENAKDI